MNDRRNCDNWTVAPAPQRLPPPAGMDSAPAKLGSQLAWLERVPEDQTQVLTSSDSCLVLLQVRCVQKEEAPDRLTSLLAALLRLSFLKVLLLDVGLSLADTCTDLVQAGSLVWDGTRLRWDTAVYGVYLVLTSLVPTLAALLHLVLTPPRPALPAPLTLGLGILAGSLLIPLLPTLAFLPLLLRHPDPGAARRALELRAVSAGLEAPLQAVLLSYLMLRGLLPLPWAAPGSASCLADSLGRVACLPSLPLASLVFSNIALTKAGLQLTSVTNTFLSEINISYHTDYQAMWNLNIWPLVAGLPAGRRRLRLCLSLTASLLPAFLATAAFRLAALALIFLFFDYWALIPCLLLWLANLVLLGLAGRAGSMGNRVAPKEVFKCQIFL